MDNWRVGTLAAALGLAGCYGSGGVGTHQEATVEVGECVPDTTTIFAGQHIDSGDIAISSDGTDLVVALSGANGWQISEYHIYAGTGPVPTGKSGAAAPGQFPYGAELDAPVAAIDVRIPLAGLGVECGDSLNVAVHTVMVLIEDGIVVDEQTGWGFGPNEFTRHWGWWFTTDICCEEPPDTCVRPKQVWRESPAEWNVTELDVGGVTMDQCELQEVLWASDPQDGYTLLARQYIGAKINEAEGADVDAQTAADLAAAEALLAANDDDAAMIAVAAGLQAYNEGLRDTPACDPLWLGKSYVPECSINDRY